MKKIILIALLVFSVSGFGADENGGYYSFGMASCGEWVKERNIVKAGTFSVNEYGFRMWISGYLTAYNRQTPNTHNILGNIDFESIRLWLDNYCQENPLKGLADGMYALTFELHPSRAVKAPD